MNPEFVLEQSPWEASLPGLKNTVPALRFLALLEGEEQWAVEEAFRDLEQRHITLDVGALPLDSGDGQTAQRLALEQALVAQGSLLEGLEENDPLKLYLQELAATPVTGDVNVLALELLAGEEAAREKLAGCMLSRVLARAGELTGRGVLLLDLIQEASLGLWEGLLHYTGGDIEAHCDWWICQYLAKIVTLQARNSGVGQKLRQGMEDFRAADRQLLTALGRNPTLEEVAAHMQISPEAAAVYEEMLTSARRMAQAKAAREPREQSPEDEMAVEDTAYFQSRQRILELLSALEPQDAELLTLRYGLEGGLPLDPQQVGARLGLTAREVVEKEAQALAKLRQG